MLIHRYVMFGGHWSNAGGHMKRLIWHVAFHNQAIEGSSIFMSGSSSWYVTILPSLVAIGIAVVEISVNFVT